MKTFILHIFTNTHTHTHAHTHTHTRTMGRESHRERMNRLRPPQMVIPPNNNPLDGANNPALHAPRPNETLPKDASTYEVDVYMGFVEGPLVYPYLSRLVDRNE